MFRQSSLTLIGMPGCGKTYWGKRLAQRLWLPALDIDDLIVERAGGRSLPTVLRSTADGERVLKQLENNCLRQVLDTKLHTGSPTIISTGGSAIYAECAAEFFRHPLNFVIHLDVPMDVLEERTENFTNRGIVFNGMTPAQLKASRDVLYRQYADLSIPMREGTDLIQLLASGFGIPLI